MNASALQPRHILFSGRVISSRRHERIFYTLVQLPAEDEWSAPSVVEIRADAPIAEPNELVQFTAKISGRRRPFTYTDRDTGDKKTGYNMDYYLDFLQYIKPAASSPVAAAIVQAGPVGKTASA